MPSSAADTTNQVRHRLAKAIGGHFYLAVDGAMTAGEFRTTCQAAADAALELVGARQEPDAWLLELAKDDGSWDRHGWVFPKVTDALRAKFPPPQYRWMPVVYAPAWLPPGQ
jgi:hypothetical protein